MHSVSQVPLLYLLQSAGDVVRQYEWRVWLYLAHPLLAYALFFGGTGADADKQRYSPYHPLLSPLQLAPSCRHTSIYLFLSRLGAAFISTGCLSGTLPLSGTPFPFYCCGLRLLRRVTIGLIARGDSPPTFLWSLHVSLGR